MRPADELQPAPVVRGKAKAGRVWEQLPSALPAGMGAGSSAAAAASSAADTAAGDDLVVVCTSLGAQCS
jgi:hypothetical protein